MIPTGTRARVQARPATMRRNQQLVFPLADPGVTGSTLPARPYLAMAYGCNGTASQVSLEIKAVAAPVDHCIDFDPDDVAGPDVHQADVVDVVAAAQGAHRHLLLAPGEVARLRPYLALDTALVAIVLVMAQGDQQQRRALAALDAVAAGHRLVQCQGRHQGVAGAQLTAQFGDRRRRRHELRL